MYLDPPLVSNFFPNKSLQLERPTSPFFGPSVKFADFFFDDVPNQLTITPTCRNGLVVSIKLKE